MSSNTDSTEHRVVMLGDQFIGKRSLRNRFLRDAFERITKVPISWDFDIKVVNITGKKHTIYFWNAPGMDDWFKSERFRFYRKSFKAALLCFDASNLDSFSGVKMGLSELREHAPDCKVFYLCATKRDLVDEAKLEGVVDMVINDVDAELGRFKFFVTSSKTGENVDGMFMEIIRDICGSQPGPMVWEDVIEKEIVTDTARENVIIKIVCPSPSSKT